MSNDSKCCAATPSGDLLRDLLDSRIAKSEREWFASREIARLKGEVEALKGELDTQESLEKFAASISAPLRIKKLEADLKRLKDAADGRGMVSEMADLPEVAVLVCGLHDKVDRLRAELDEYKSWANGRRPERVNKEIEQLRADLSACRKELDEARQEGYAQGWKHCKQVQDAVNEASIEISRKTHQALVRIIVVVERENDPDWSKVQKIKGIVLPFTFPGGDVNE